MTTIKAKKVIENHAAFKKFYSLTGEDYNSALEIWIEQYYSLVGVHSADEAEKLIYNIENIKTKGYDRGSIR